MLSQIEYSDNSGRYACYIEIYSFVFHLLIL